MDKSINYFYFCKKFYLENKRLYINLSDDELLYKFIETLNQELLGQLYSRYIPLVYGLCLKYLQQIDDAKDAVSNLYEELNTKIRNYRIENFKAWLYTVTTNHCLQILRKEKNRFVEEIEIQNMESDEFEHLIDISEDKAREDALNYCLSTLSKGQQRCITHFYFDDFSYADIVEKTGFELNKVKSYIQNGKRNLKICILKKMKS